MPPTEPTDATRVLVVERGGAATGLVVDMVCGVINLESSEKEAPPPLLGNGASGVDTRYVNSVIKADGGRRIIMEIDADALCLTEVAKEGMSGSEMGSGVSREETARGAPDEIQLVTFLVAREEYAFPIASVREVLRIGDITEVPDVAPYLLGILSIRNALLPVVDIRRLFGLPSLEENLAAELEEAARFAHHLEVSFSQHLTHGAAWTPDAIWSAVGSWFDALHTSSELLGRQFQLLRLLFQKLRALTTGARRERGRQVNAADGVRVMEECKVLVEQIAQRVAECKKALGREIQEDQRILVIEIGRMPVGVLVDRMRQVIRLPEQIIEHPPVLLNTEKSSALKGIVKLDGGRRLVMLIDQERMLHGEELGDLGGGYQSGGETLPPEESGNADAGLQLVTFYLDGEEFGLGIEEVQEINRLDDITAVPRAPAFVEGVMNLRGNVIPAIDLRRRFGLGPVEHDESTRVIIVNMSGRLTGLIVDGVSEVLRLQRRSIEAPPEVIRTDLNTRFIKGICKDERHGGKMIVLIEVSRILADHEQELLLTTLDDAPPAMSVESGDAEGAAGTETEPVSSEPASESAAVPSASIVPEASPPTMPTEFPVPQSEQAATPPAEASTATPVSPLRKKLKRAT